MRISVTISSCCRSVVNRVMKKPSTGITLSPLRSDGDNLRSQSHHGGGMIVGGIAVRKIARQGRHIPHLRIGDHP